MKLFNYKQKNTLQNQENFLPSIFGFGPRVDWIFVLGLFFILIISISVIGFYFYKLAITENSDYYQSTSNVNGILDQKILDNQVLDFQTRKSLFDELTAR
ncbi:MAG TPA: hypothetical protein PJ997_01300 [Candidatus Paceibacterota bacterium]|nr:hypothetical protein [Candidatus Paceibacterota bacterium]HMP18957.1 hypothetical protein [Candidatus Paceibacterota bacterium]HMP85578.1 hypothetical protein [Candidatus Paceibacterota bacterium]